MKRRVVALTTAFVLTAGLMAGCGSAQNAAEAPAQTEQTEVATEAAQTAEATQEQAVGLANPWVDITEDQAKENCLRLFKAPEGAQVKGWSMCEALGDSSKGIKPLVQLTFEMDGNEFTARAQEGASEDTDIAGIYAEWAVGPEDVTLANWGGGNMTGKTYRAVSDEGYTDLITWYDVEIGIAYSLSVSAKDLDGFDIQAVAEQMYSDENEPYGNIPDDFLQEQSGLYSFATYDDVIAALQPGQGYAYIKLIGSDKEVLAVTDLVFEYDHSAYEVSIYNMVDGEAKMVGSAMGNGSSNPLRLADGVLYGGDNHTYETYFISQEFGSLMAKDMISDGINSGSNELTGFTREKNTFDEATDFTGTEEDLHKLLAERETKPIIEFTMVE